MPDDKFTPGPEYSDAASEEGVTIVKQPLVTLNVQFVTSENMPLTYVDHGIATATGTEVVVSMFQTRHPIGPVKSGDTIQTHCMVRLVMAPPKAFQLYHALGGALGISPPDMEVRIETGERSVK